MKWFKTIGFIGCMFLLLPVHAQIEEARMVNPDSNIKSKNIVVIGASYARGWSIDKVGCLDVVNKSNDGEQSSEVRARFVNDAFSSDPEAVIIWGYINDLHRNPKEQVEQTIEDIKDNVQVMVDETRQRGKIPVLATEVTLGVSESLKWKIMSFIGKLRGKTSYQEFINSNVLALNEWAREYAKSENILVLDIEKVLTNPKGNRKEGFAQIDGSHINDPGYQAISDMALPFLKNKLVDKNQLCM